MWGWFFFTTAPARFWGPLGIYAGTDGSPTTGTAFHQISSATSGGTQLVLGSGAGTAVNLVNITAGNWYFVAMTATGTGAGTVNGYARTLTANTLTAVTNSNSFATFTAARAEWGRDAFTGDPIDGRIHACGMADAALSVDELLELSYFHEPQLDGIRSLNCFYPTIESVNTNASIDRSGNVRDATVTHGALVDGPPLLWRAIPPSWNLPASAASGAITGSSTLIFSPTGTLTGDGALSGSTTLTFSPTSTLTGNAPITGSTSLTFSPTATLTGLAPITGSSSLTFSPTSTLTGTGALSGTTSITFTATGTLADSSASGALVGASTLAFTVTGTLTGAGDLVGATTITFTPTGTLRNASAVTDTNSGGYFYDIDAHHSARSRRKERERELKLDEIELERDREIARLLHEQEARDADRADLTRIQALADRYAGTRQPVPRNIAAALLKAQEERSRNALEQLQREVERQLEEESIAIAALLLLDD